MSQKDVPFQRLFAATVEQNRLLESIASKFEQYQGGGGGGGGGDDGYKFVEKTQAQYDAMSSHDPKTVYFIVDSPSDTDYVFTEKTQAEYDEMESHDPHTVYFIIGQEMNK